MSVSMSVNGSIFYFVVTRICRLIFLNHGVRSSLYVAPSAESNDKSSIDRRSDACYATSPDDRPMEWPCQWRLRVTYIVSTDTESSLRYSDRVSWLMQVYSRPYTRPSTCHLHTHDLSLSAVQSVRQCHHPTTEYTPAISNLMHADSIQQRVYVMYM